MFPSAHQRYLRSRFHYIDELLGEAIRALDSHPDSCLFRRVAPDATSAQRKILGDYVSQVRNTLARFMKAQRIEEGTPPASGLWSMRTAVTFAQTAVAEMRPSYLRGYGALDPDASAACERLVGELAALLNRVSDYLDKGADGDLAGRLARLDAAGADVALLRQLERIVTVHGLVEFRAPIEELVARAAEPRYEIAVFGRVNVGKSSLLNWWLGADVLPTGITPVTAVPTRIVHGASAEARVQIASGAPLRVDIKDIGAYITETGNPGNARRLLALTLVVPSERLSDGICLVDTPGLGSLAAAGAVQTLEYLPRCDLAIQMIEAGAPIGSEEIDLARTIIDGGSDVLVVLSKADRLSAAELTGARTYVAEQFNTALGLSVPVDPISTVGGSQSRAGAWFSRRIAPRLADHRARAAVQLQRKIEVLRERVGAALQVRLHSSGAEHAPEIAAEADAAHRPRADEHAAQCRLALQHARDELRSLIPRIRSRGRSWLIAGAAEALGESWMAERAEPITISTRVERAIADRAVDIGEALAEVLTRCRTQIDTLLAPKEREDAHGTALARARGRPLFDASALAERLHTVKPFWLPRIRLLVARVARLRVDGEDFHSSLTERLLTYAEALRLWSEAYVEELARAVDGALALEESRSRSGGQAALTGEAADAARRDLALLASTHTSLESARRGEK